MKLLLIKNMGVVALLMIGLYCASCGASEIELRRLVSETGFVSNHAYLYGPLVAGDGKKFAQFFIANSELQKLVLNSPGGDVQEGLKIGEIVKSLRLQTYVELNGKCASSCFFVWLNGTWRYANGPELSNGDNGWIGLHRPYLVHQNNNDESLVAQNSAVKFVASYLENKLVPRRLIDYILSRPSNDIYWLSEKDLNDLGDNPPDLEELYIAKCNESNRRLKIQLAQALKAGEKQFVKAVLVKSDNLISCTQNLDKLARAEAVVKLKKGWLPTVVIK